MKCWLDRQCSDSVFREGDRPGLRVTKLSTAQFGTDALKGPWVEPQTYKNDQVNKSLLVARFDDSSTNTKWTISHKLYDR